MMKRITAYLSTLFLLTACNNPSMSFQWNDLEEYGTYYPAELKTVAFPLNGKGFSATDGIAELWADTYLWMLPDDCSGSGGPDCHDHGEEDELIGASKYLHGRTDPVCVSDNIIENNGIRERRKTVAYRDAFYTVSFSYPVSQSEHYQSYEAAIFDDFPVLRNPGR